MTWQRRALALVLVTAFVAAACDSGSDGSSGGDSGASGASGTTGETLTIAVLQPFSGPDAAYGPEVMAGCVPAKNIINENGGVLGNDLECIAVDTQSNPSEAVPAVQQAVTTEENLIAFVGTDSAVAPATVPVLSDTGVVYWPNTGNPRYNQYEDDMYWRLAVSDDQIGIALALFAAEQQGHERVAIVGANDSNSQEVTPSLSAALQELGAEIVAEETIALGQTSYRASANSVAEADPDVIITPTTDPPTISTFLGEFVELHDPVPVIGQVPPLQPRFSRALKGAIGGDAQYEELYSSVGQKALTEGPAWEAFNEALLASEDEVENPSQWSEDPFSMGGYDPVIIMALAMISAESTDPQDFNSHILTVTEPGDGKTTVHTFPEGKEALETGESIQYVGALGEITFNEWHNFAGSFIATRESGDSVQEIAEVSPQRLAEVQAQLPR